MQSKELIETLRSFGVDDECLRERFDNDPELYTECFDEFLKEPCFQALERALAEKDYPRSFSAAHSMKGLAANLSLREVYGKLFELVEALRGEHYENLDGQYAAMMKELARLRALRA